MSAPLVLLTEDDALIGFDLSDALEAAGYRVAGPFARVADALLAIECETPALAILDVMLLDGVSVPLARELRRRDVPFLVHSGRHHAEPLAIEFQGAPWLDKPTRSRAVAARLGELLRGSLAVTPAGASNAAPLEADQAALATGRMD